MGMCCGGSSTRTRSVRSKTDVKAKAEVKSTAKKTIHSQAKSVPSTKGIPHGVKMASKQKLCHVCKLELKPQKVKIKNSALIGIVLKCARCG